MLYIAIIHVIVYVLCGYIFESRMTYKIFTNIAPNMLLVLTMGYIYKDYSFHYNYHMDIFKLPIFAVVYDQIFYALHRLFHAIQSLYKYHKQHHLYTDEKNAWVAIDCSIIEHIVLNLFPFITAMILLNFSYYGCLLITAYVTINITWAHSEIPSGYHSIHHIKQNCNYGIMLFADRMYGTKYKKNQYRIRPYDFKILHYQL